jgi:aminopeptidase
VLDLAPDDRVLVVTDAQTRPCGEAFFRAAAEHGCEAQLHVLPVDGRPLTVVPSDMPALLENVDVVVNALVGDPREVPFRLAWIRAVEGAGRIRLGHSPGIDEDMMLAGPLNVDYARMNALSVRLLDNLNGAETLRITTPAGTELTLNVGGRSFINDLKATVHAGANLPCGEIYCAPIETGADGRLVVDGCFGGHGRVPAPIAIDIVQGRAVDVTCADPEVRRTVVGLMDTDEGARTIAELGIGLNEGARLTPRMLEAEKSLGTAHIAFGDNDGIAGGQSRSCMHMDYLFTNPTIEAFFAAGEPRVVLQDGHAAD